MVGRHDVEHKAHQQGSEAEIQTQKKEAERANWTKPALSDILPLSGLHHLNLPKWYHQQAGDHVFRCPSLWETVLIQTPTQPMPP